MSTGYIGMSLADFLDKHVLRCLSVREKEIAALRHKDVFGMGENAETLRAIGERHALSHSRVGEIVRKCHRKIQYALHLADQKMGDAHVVVKYVPHTPEGQEGKKSTLPLHIKRITDLGPLSERTCNCLRSADLMILENLLEQTPRNLLRIPNFGYKSLHELEQLLKRNGLQLQEEMLKIFE